MKWSGWLDMAIVASFMWLGLGIAGMFVNPDPLAQGILRVGPNYWFEAGLLAIWGACFLPPGIYRLRRQAIAIIRH